jgi:hypothetical protein
MSKQQSKRSSRKKASSLPVEHIPAPLIGLACLLALQAAHEHLNGINSISDEDPNGETK